MKFLRVKVPNLLISNHGAPRLGVLTQRGRWISTSIFEWPTDWKKPLAITETDLSHLMLFNSEKSKKNPPPLHKDPLTSTGTNICSYADDLYRMASRYGDHVIIDVWKNLKELKKFITEIPSEKVRTEFFKICQIKEIQDVFHTLFEKKKSVPKEIKHLKTLKKEWNNMKGGPEIPVRREYLKIKQFDQFKKYFIHGDANPTNQNIFKCHNLVYAMILKMCSDGRLKKMLEMIDLFDSNMKITKCIPIVCVETAKNPDDLTREKIRKFALKKVFGEGKVGDYDLEFKENYDLMAGFKMNINNERTFDYSLKGNLEKVLGEKD